MLEKFQFIKNMEPGGSWKPESCIARHKVAIVLPYRDRLDNLNTWLYNMHPVLQNMELEYTIFVVEQLYDEPYNKGILMNAAFDQIFNMNITKKKYDCIFYHDVDMLPTGKMSHYL